MLGIVKALQALADASTGLDGVLAVTIEIGAGIGGEHALCTNHELGGKLLVFVEDAWREA